MIDVVFLLLVFFMLAARFDLTTVVPIVDASGAQDYSGPPRVIDVRAETLALNGVTIADTGLAAALASLMSAPTDLVVLRAGEGADVQRLLDVMTALRAEGIATLTLVE